MPPRQLAEETAEPLAFRKELDGLSEPHRASAPACARMCSLLQSSPAFIEIGRDQWQLGRRALVG